MKVKQDVLQFKTSWVKTHQDNNKPKQELNFNAQLNISANADVNTFQNTTPEHLESSTTPTIFHCQMHSFGYRQSERDQ
eukprot:2011842-Ditylum_brightwellii.AAC.1